MFDQIHVRLTICKTVKCYRFNNLLWVGQQFCILEEMLTLFCIDCMGRYYLKLYYHKLTIELYNREIKHICQSSWYFEVKYSAPGEARTHSLRISSTHIRGRYCL